MIRILLEFYLTRRRNRRIARFDSRAAAAGAKARAFCELLISGDCRHWVAVRYVANMGKAKYEKLLEFELGN